MIRALLVAAAACLLVVPAAFAALLGQDQQGQAGETTVLEPGDTVRLAGTDLACAATKRGGRAALECRVTDDPVRTYGTFLTERRATVARFVSGDTAQTVFIGRHRGGWKTCGGARRSSAAVVARQGGCR